MQLVPLAHFPIIKCNVHVIVTGDNIYEFDAKLPLIVSSNAVLSKFHNEVHSSILILLLRKLKLQLP